VGEPKERSVAGPFEDEARSDGFVQAIEDVSFPIGCGAQGEAVKLIAKNARQLDCPGCRDAQSRKTSVQRIDDGARPMGAAYGMRYQFADEERVAAGLIAKQYRRAQAIVPAEGP
jgi:hypothetical protein